MKKQSVYTIMVVICMICSYFFKSYFTFPTSYKTITSDKIILKTQHSSNEEQDSISILTDFSDENDSISSKLNFKQNCIIYTLLFNYNFCHLLKSELRKVFVLANIFRSTPIYIAISVFRI